MFNNLPKMGPSLNILYIEESVMLDTEAFCSPSNISWQIDWQSDFPVPEAPPEMLISTEQFPRRWIMNG